MTSSAAVNRRTVLIWIVLELIAALQVRTDDGSTVLGRWMRAVISPITWSAERLGSVGVDVWLGTHDLQRVISDNRMLKIELQELRAHQALLEEDLRALREAIDLTDAASELDVGTVVGRVTYRNLAAGIMEARSTTTEFLPLDTPVVTADGLVGRVIRNEGRRHWIELITHGAAAVAVESADGTIQGLAIGTTGAEVNVEYVPRQADLRRGAALMTSSADGIYPPGIPVVRVTRIRETDSTFLEVGALPRADLRTARVVLFLPNWARGDPGGN